MPSTRRDKGSREPSRPRAVSWEHVLGAFALLAPILDAPALGSTFQEIGKLAASDARPDHLFGYTVAISGDTVVVNARFDDHAGPGSGAAYVFERSSGGPNGWGEVRKLTASDAASEDYFGASLAISRDTIVVGSPSSDVLGLRSGAAYVFERNEGGPDNWGELRKLTASDAGDSDQFGGAVAIAGDTLIIGARNDGDAGSWSGSAYVFERDAGGADNWGEVRKLTASDAAAEDYFGCSVVISGDTAVVGSYYADHTSVDAGAAYVFERDAGGADNWGEVRKLVATDAATGDLFGSSVGVAESTVIVGAFHSDAAASEAGSAYIFERDAGGTDNWGQIRQLLASDAAADDVFGLFVAISGEVAMVGAWADDDAGSYTGAAYAFERDSGGAGNWGETQKLTASDAAAFASFGWSVAMSGNTMAIGAQGADAAMGSASVFEVALSAVLYRGVVASVAPGWRGSALPLSDATDDELAPFPIMTTVAGTEADGVPPVAPLVLYRVLLDGTRDAGNVLRAVGDSTGVVTLTY